MIGTLLKDVATGMDFATVSARFASKMHPLKYQRPQAAPRVGNIADAEKIVAQLGIARSLERRFARIDEIDTLWKYRPVPEVPDRVRVFSRLVAGRHGTHAARRSTDHDDLGQVRGHGPADSRIAGA